jgi:hypothetical protein
MELILIILPYPLVIFREFEHRDPVIDAGVVDQNVDATEIVQNLRHRIGHVGLVGNIDVETTGLLPQPLNGGGHPFQVRRAAAAYRNVGPGFGQGQSGDLTQAPGATGHHGNFTFQFELF